MERRQVKQDEDEKAVAPQADEEVMRPAKKREEVRRSLSARRAGFTRPPYVNIRESEKGHRQIVFDGDNADEEHLYLIEAFGLSEPASANMLLDQLTRLYNGDFDRRSDTRMNRALHMLAELNPEGGEEAMLCAQMVATHIAAMECMQRALLEGQTFDGRELNLKYGAKLLQAYTQQFAALDKKRRGGQQKVIVKHVHVNEGGQAIVGDVSTGGGS